jgi:hypothetical protein
MFSNKKLNTIVFNNEFKYKQYLKKHKPDKYIFGDINPIYHCMTEHFKTPLKVYNPKFYTLDIEVYSSSEFPDAEHANYMINLVTLCDYQNKKYYSFGLKPFTNNSEYDVEYDYCRTEIELIENVLLFIENNNIKCLTGWNTNGFDVPYIINRMKKFEYNSVIISNYLNEHINTYGKIKTFKTVQVIDYMELYKKFKMNKLERYSLDFVSQYEGFQGKKKMECTLSEASDERWDDYVLYNIIDNVKIVELEGKLKFIKQAFSMANDNKCLPVDVYSPIKMWDSAIYFELYHRNILIPPKLPDVIMKLIGGYVGSPNTDGIQKYLSVFDIASSYPHQIMQFNISIETRIGDRRLHPELMEIRNKFTPSISEMENCTDEQFKAEWKRLKKTTFKQGRTIEELPMDELNIYRIKYNIYRFSQMDLDDFIKTYTPILIKHNVAMTANLQFYKKSFVGIFPELMKKYFGIRNVAKKNEAILRLQIAKIKEQIGIKQDIQINEKHQHDLEMIDDDFDGDDNDI